MAEKIIILDAFRNPGAYSINQLHALPLGDNEVSVAYRALTVCFQMAQKSTSPNFNAFHFQKKLSNKKLQRGAMPDWEFCQPPEALNFSM